jgi:hypothetical protein
MKVVVREQENDDGDDVARVAGCRLHDRPLPTASQLMSAAAFDE